VTGIHPRPLVIGHRGNTLDALRQVRARGADGVEVDVRRAGDGSLVLHHDAFLAGRGPISGLAGRQIPSVVPRLEAALVLCQGLVINLEVKNLPTDPDPDPAERAARDVATLVGERSLQDRVIVSAFTLATLDAVRAVDPSIATAYLTLPDWDQPLALRHAADRGHRALHPHRRALTPSLVRLAHAAGMWLTPWGVDLPRHIANAAAAGADAMITDDPATAITVLGQRCTCPPLPSGPALATVADQVTVPGLAGRGHDGR
jgi:glycerophosphoryl diester phosphodiesterase